MVQLLTWLAVGLLAPFAAELVAAQNQNRPLSFDELFTTVAHPEGGNCGYVWGYLLNQMVVDAHTLASSGLKLMDEAGTPGPANRLLHTFFKYPTQADIVQLRGNQPRMYLPTSGIM